MTRRKRLLVPLALACFAGVVLLLPRCGVQFKLYLFSPVDGVVLMNGKPVAGAEVEQQWGYSSGIDRPSTRKVKTDAQGRFSFPEITEFSLIGLAIVLQPTAIERILIRHNGSEYLAWHYFRTDWDRLGELGRPIRLTCELTAESTNKTNLLGLERISGIATIDPS